ncbi:SIR2 family protein [Acinetobacter sp. ANC 4177]|uniref:SIR2 family protein n=1 Tax=Acinetobacter sp. ANC 4177 TaxID=2529838 RepID=UPI0013F15F9D|nr:SIR2 family protein [Acinetobacter sp. ANC 4177]
MPNVIDNRDNVLLEEILNHVASRGAILFLGSGFSASANGLNDDLMPTAEKLAQKIGDLKAFDAEKDLKYATDRFMSDDGDGNELIKVLRETFTVKSVKPHHVAIASAPWRRVYTTNYDLCYEKAAEEIGKLINTVDLNHKPSDYSAKNELCVHLNGSLLSLSLDSLENDFKLTTSSYLSPNSFVDSNWYYQFQRDLEYSSAIVFVGYSMYDIEVQKILHNNPHYTGKTYFITRSLKGGKDQFTLQQFGKILPIGAENFGIALEKKQGDFLAEPEDLQLTSIWEYTVNQSNVVIRDANVDAFLMYGSVNDILIDSSIKGIKGAPLLIPRDNITLAIEILKSNRNLIVTAEFGNGKSTFLKELRTRLTLAGKRVFIIDEKDPYQHDDLDQLIKRNIPGILIIDSYDQNMDLLSHYAELKPDNLKIVISTRTSIHERNRIKLEALDLELNELVIDELSHKEAIDFINIIDNIGYWGDKVAYSEERKYKEIKKNKSQISQNLLALFSSPQMISRIKDISKQLLENSSYKDTIFAISILSADNRTLSSSLISRIALNDAIYSADLRGNQQFQQMFQIKGTKITEKSSIFAITLISHLYQSSYIVDQLLKIVSSLEGENGELREIKKNLMRFSVVEPFLPETQRKQSLIRYYENLKRELYWLKNDPHFWLQYGMAQLTFADFNKAQTYFDQAYALATKNLYKHTDHIDTQQARLYLLQATSQIEPAKASELFNKAHQLISKLPNDIHKYRQIELYKDIYNICYSSFNNSNKAQFEHACKRIIRDLLTNDEDIILNARDNKALKLKEMLEGILSKIIEARTA